MYSILFTNSMSFRVTSGTNSNCRHQIFESKTKYWLSTKTMVDKTAHTHKMNERKREREKQKERNRKNNLNWKGKVIERKNNGRRKRSMEQNEIIKLNGHIGMNDAHWIVPTRVKYTHKICVIIANGTYKFEKEKHDCNQENYTFYNIINGRFVEFSFALHLYFSFACLFHTDTIQIHIDNNWHPTCK